MATRYQVRVYLGKEENREKDKSTVEKIFAKHKGRYTGWSVEAISTAFSLSCEVDSADLAGLIVTKSLRAGFGTHATPFKE